MHNREKDQNETPFFAQFLEDQDVAQAQGGAETTTSLRDSYQTLKYPSDGDENQVTLKYPSDGDEGTIISP